MADRSVSELTGSTRAGMLGTEASGLETAPDAASCRCREQLVVLFAARGIEMAVSAQPPLVPSPYEDLGLRCPHGTRWYTEPTSDQQLAWAAGGAR